MLSGARGSETVICGEREGRNGFSRKAPARLLAGLKLRREKPRAFLLEDASDPWDELVRELERSRRYGRPFSLVALSLDEPGRAVNGHEAAILLSAALRTIDRAWWAGGTAYFLLPETDREMAVSLLARIRGQSPEILAAREVSVASFPEDGLTQRALLASLRPPEPAANGNANGNGVANGNGHGAGSNLNDDLVLVLASGNGNSLRRS
jgi:hypothetical protein